MSINEYMLILRDRLNPLVEFLAIVPQTISAEEFRAVKNHAENTQDFGIRFAFYLDRTNDQPLLCYAQLIYVRARHSSLSKIRALECVWGLFAPPGKYFLLYLELIRGLVKAQKMAMLSDKFHILNFSQQPPEPIQVVAGDPVALLLQSFCRKNIVTVVAAGNCGANGKGSISAWATLPSVISVGAATVDGSRVCSFSGRGGRGMPGPTVVAPGKNIIGAWGFGTVKDPQREARDRKFITEETWLQQTGEHRAIDDALLDLYTVESGTSQATAIVSGLCGTIISIRKWLGLDVTCDIVKGILREAALPVPNVRVEIAGSGFIDNNILKSYFGNIDAGNFKSTYWPNDKQLCELVGKKLYSVNCIVVDDGFDLQHPALKNFLFDER